MENLTVIDFYAEWCTPCKMMSPIFDELMSTYNDNGMVEIKKLDVEKNTELARKFGVRSVPTILFIKNDEVVDKLIGATNKHVLIDKIENLK